MPGTLRHGMGRSLLAAVAAGMALIHGTPHGDRISAVDGKRQTIRCGAGPDVVVADLADQVAPDCETVSRRISFDRTVGPSQHQTEVEPAAAAFGSTVVSTFQVSRFLAGGGAAAIGFASSADGGRSWRSGLLPGLTAASGGPWSRASDPVIAYDAQHGVWLAASLAFSDASSVIAVSRSPDGDTWEAPVTADSGSGPFAYDKEWLACDNGAASPFRGNCYLAWSDAARGVLTSQVSRDGGLTWSAPVTAAPKGPEASGAQPAVLPDGTLLVLFLRGQKVIEAVRSQDGGASFGPELTVSDLRFATPPVLRAPPLPSVATDADGRVYVAWSDCRFRPGCGANDVVLSSSDDGLSWSAPTRAATGLGSVSELVPALGADASGRLALTYYVAGRSTTGVGFTESADGGASWSPPRRLDAAPMRTGWLAVAAFEGSAAPFLGDYIATPFVAGRPMPVFALATGEGREAIFALVTSRSGARRS